MPKNARGVNPYGWWKSYFFLFEDIDNRKLRCKICGWKQSHKDNAGRGLWNQDLLSNKLYYKVRRHVESHPRELIEFMRMGEE